MMSFERALHSNSAFTHGSIIESIGVSRQKLPKQTLIIFLKAVGTVQESFRTLSCRIRGTPRSLLPYMIRRSCSGTGQGAVET